MKKIINLFAIFSFSLIIFNGCYEDYFYPYEEENGLTMAIIADVHLFPSELYNPADPDFQQYLTEGRKLLEESEAVLKAAVAKIIAEKPNVLIIPGDLTKDGEKASHERLVYYLKQIEDAGIKVYITPGNHDILNSQAYSYPGSGEVPVATVTPKEFRTLYSDFGFKEAIYSDPNSLSYIAKPKKNVWLLSIDANKYEQNTDNRVFHDGAIKPETLQWIKEKLAEAKENNIEVFAFMHHGIMEHFTGQASNPITSGYVIDDFRTIYPQLAELGLQIVFTGHSHANDIVISETFDFYDIETGSLIGPYPPIRFISYKDNMMKIETYLVNQVDYETNGKPWLSYTEYKVKSGIQGTITEILTDQFNLSQIQAYLIASFGTDAYLAHVKGDESMPAEYQILIDQIKKNNDPVTNLLATYLEAAYTDLPIADNNVEIILNQEE